MAKKEISPINFKKYTDINEINMTSRLLGKMLDEHEKKIKENIVTQPIRVSQKIQSQEKIQTRENKITSVLSSVKQQVVIENTRIFNSTNRSPEEKELRISVNSNLPILMEKEKDEALRAKDEETKKTKNALSLMEKEKDEALRAKDEETQKTKNAL